jgi:hypothetical protein
MAPGNQVFGQTMKKSNKNSRYQRQFGNGNKGKSKSATVYKSASADDPAAARRRYKQEQGQQIDRKFGYEKFSLTNNAQQQGELSRRGWLFQMLPTTVRSFIR